MLPHKIKMPKPMLKILQGWDYVHKSPTSNSLYNMQVDGDYFPAGCIRLSNHWNYYKDNHISFNTNRPVINGWWTLAINRGNVWEVIKSCQEKNTKSYYIESANNVRSL